MLLKILVYRIFTVKNTSLINEKTLFYGFDDKKVGTSLLNTKERACFFFLSWPHSLHLPDSERPMDEGTALESPPLQKMTSLYRARCTNDTRILAFWMRYLTLCVYGL